MAGYMVFGDAEAAVCAIVRSSAEVAAFTGVAVATDLNGYTKGGRWVRVTRTGGAPVMWMLLDSPVIEVAAYAESKATAHDLAQAVRGALFAAQGQYVGNGLALYDVRDDAGMRWDPDDGTPRYVLDLSLVTRPVEP